MESQTLTLTQVPLEKRFGFLDSNQVVLEKGFEFLDFDFDSGCIGEAFWILVLSHRLRLY